MICHIGTVNHSCLGWRQRLARGSVGVVIIYFLRNDITRHIVALSIQSSRSIIFQSESRTLPVVSLLGSLHLPVLRLSHLPCHTAAIVRAVPVVPIGRTVHVESEHVACIVTNIVRRTEHVINIIHHLVPHILDRRSPSLKLMISRPVAVAAMNGGVILQHVGSCRIESAIHIARIHIHIRFPHKVLLFVISQQLPVPPRDDIVQVESRALIVHLHAISRNLPVLTPREVTVVGIKVRLHIEQLQLAVRARRDGKRNLHLLAIGSSSPRISRHLLVIHIHLTLDVPIVGRRLHIPIIIHPIVRIAVIHNALTPMNEIARSLTVVKFTFCFTILIISIGSCSLMGGTYSLIVWGKDDIIVGNQPTLTVFILCIHIATTHKVFLHVDQVKFHDTCNITIIFLSGCTVLRGQFEEHT